MSETIEQKADRYLTSGAVKAIFVGNSRGEFEVSGSDTYTVEGPSWMCSCPARVLECAHILACKKITKFESVKEVSLTGTDENSQFLADLLSS